MTITSVSLDPQIASRGKKRAQRLKGKSGRTRYSFSAYVEELIRRDLTEKTLDCPTGATRSQS